MSSTLASGKHRKIHLAFCALLLVLAAFVVVNPNSASATTATASSSIAVEDLCGSALPGHARCLSMRQVTGRRAVANNLAGSNASAAITPSGLGPSDLSEAYQLDTTKGSGQTVAIVDAYDDPTAAADLAVYRSQYGLPACTVANGCFAKVSQSGTTSPLPSPNAGWAGEISLDLDMVSAVCPQCNILLVEASSSSLSDLGTAVDTAVRLGAKFVSNSYGGSEWSGQTAADTYYNHPGVVITASSGDSGYGMSYPASSPYVTAVGGTTLSRSSSTTRGWTETAWGGAGSGCSSVSAKPSIQNTVTTSCTRRAVADVSAVANPSTGVAVYGTYGGGGWGVYGGTSASAPIIASTYALAGTPGTSDYPNTYPYTNSSSLFDVTSGTNGSCSTHNWCAAGTGWDGPTGLGTPDTAAAFSATGQVDGTPVKFGAALHVTSPAVPGIGTQATLTALLPDGDDVASISWKAGRADCSFNPPTAAETTITCAAAATGSTTVTATAVDTAGATKIVTVPLAFNTTGTKRNLAVSLSVTGQSGTGQSICAGASTPIQALVTDVTTGSPVRGVTVSFTRQAGTAAAASLPAKATGVDGTAASTVSSTTAVTLTAKTAAIGPFNAFAGTSIAVTAAQCSTTLSAAANKTSAYYADAVTVTGLLTRDASGVQVALPGAPVWIQETVDTKTTTLATVSTKADGSFSAVVHPVASGTLLATLAASSAWTAATASIGDLTVLAPRTTLTAGANLADVGYLNPVVASGTLLRNGATSTALARSTVSIVSTPASGSEIVMGKAIVATDGTWMITIKPRASGQLSARYGGAPGQPAATADIEALTVGTWTTGLTLSTELSSVTAGNADKVTGVVTRAYGSDSGGAPALQVKLYLVTTTGASNLLTTVTTNASGVYSGSVYPTENGTIVAKVASIAGYADSASDGVPVSVTTRVTGSTPAIAAATKPFTVTASVSAPRAAAVTIYVLSGSTWTSIASGTTETNGVLRVSVPGRSAGKYTLRVSFGGDDRGSANVSANFGVTVR
jgi:hypothetical protein